MSRYLCSLCALIIVCLFAPCDAGVQFNLTKSAPSSPSSPIPTSVLSATPSTTESLFISHLRQYNKVYSAAEFQRRFTVFSANVALIDAHNAAESSSHRLGITEHADWTEAEFRQYRLGYRRPASKAALSDSGCDAAVYSSAVPTTSLDWRASNAVSGVKNQGTTVRRHWHTNSSQHPPYTALTPNRAVAVCLLG